jgi:hypothetical protein
MEFWLNVLIWSLLLGLLPAWIAHTKGQSFFAWWMFGLHRSAMWLLVPIATRSDMVAVNQGSWVQEAHGNCSKSNSTGWP